ncbi:MAG: hypothetical protein ACI85I_000857 [Arenicella sp.]|jgi:hypothetical protein
MKNVLFIMLAMFLFSCGGTEKTEETKGTEEVTTTTDADMSKEDFKKSLKYYILLKDALVASSVNQAKIEANKLSRKTEGELADMAKELQNSDDIAKQRAVFQKISDKMYTMVKEMGSTHDVYYVHCPMAFENKGAYWLSEEEEVKNPYFGDEMMNCGEVKETISATETM